MKNIVPLSDIKAGQSGVVEEIKDNGFLSQRILEMGIIPGTTIEVVRFAPMGDPIDIKIRGYHLSLRRQEAEHIQVTICPVIQN